jgi:gamma-glutamylcyclotransferase (GGCT)/AIG2-like uncharacterized protein YtfP
MPEPLPSATRRHVFVYGTLRRGDERDITRLRPAPRFVGMASVSGVLYHLGPYPGVLLGGPTRVSGEVYEISAALERQLDEIEEVWPQPTGEYSKRQVRALLQPAGAAAALELDCLVYEIDPARTAGRAVIASGDWLQGRALQR